MGQSINLVPQQEVQEQTKTRVVKLSTVLSILIVIVFAGVSAYFYYNTAKLKDEVKAADKEVGRLRSEINSLSGIEITARNLDTKYSALRGIFKSQVFYSELVREFRLRQPKEVELNDFTVMPDSKISMNAKGDGYIYVSNFINTLLDKNFKGGIPGLEGLFTSVTLNSVTLENKTNRIVFSMSIEFNKDLLKNAR